MEKVVKIAHSSEENGTAVANALTTPGVKAAELASALAGSPSRSSRTSRRRRTSTRPGRCAPRTQHIVEALQFRVSGVQGLADTFRQTADVEGRPSDAALLATQAQRLLASDVVWDDLFKDPRSGSCSDEGVSGVPVPDSNFVANPDLVEERSMALRPAAPARRRDRRHADRPPRHEHRRRKALPGGQVLSPTGEHGHGDTDLAFVGHGRRLGRLAGGQDQGDADDPAAAGRRSCKTKTIDLINPGETKTVTFSEPRPGAVRDEDDGQGRRRSRCRARRTPTTTRPVPGHLLAAVDLAVARHRNRRAVVAIVGVAVGAVGARPRLVAWVKVKRVRDAQRSLLGGGRQGPRRLRRLAPGPVDDLHRAVDEVAAGLARVDRRVDGTSRTRRSSATTPTRTRAATSRPRSRSSTRRAPGSS